MFCIGTSYLYYQQIITLYRQKMEKVVHESMRPNYLKYKIISSLFLKTDGWQLA